MKGDHAGAGSLVPRISPPQNGIFRWSSVNISHKTCNRCTTHTADTTTPHAASPGPPWGGRGIVSRGNNTRITSITPPLQAHGHHIPTSGPPSAILTPVIHHHPTPSLDPPFMPVIPPAVAPAHLGEAAGPLQVGPTTISQVSSTATAQAMGLPPTTVHPHSTAGIMVSATHHSVPCQSVPPPPFHATGNLF